MSNISYNLLPEVLKKDGFFIVKSNLKEESEILCEQHKISNIVGVPREHNLGKKDYAWPICLKESESKIITFSEHNGEAELHTDSQYSEIPERYMSLSCIHEANCGGGESYVLDTEKVKAQLAEDKEFYEVLKGEFPIAIPDIFQSENVGKKVVFKPLLSDYPKFRYRYDTIKKGLLLAEIPETDVRWSALEKLRQILDNSEFIERFMLKQGDILVVDNHRLLHGRSCFSDPKRLLYRIRMDEKQ